MTVIAVRAGVMAADTRRTDNGTITTCTKLFYRGGDIIGLAGDDGPALLFVDWYKSGRAKPEIFVTGEADFFALVLDSRRRVWLYDKWCRGEQIRAPFYAIGTGADAALGAMHAGKSAIEAARIACKIDMHCGLPVTYMSIR